MKRINSIHTEVNMNNTVTYSQDRDTAVEQRFIARIRELSVPLEPRPTDIAERVHFLPTIQAVLFDIYGTLFISGAGDISIADEMTNQQACAEALQAAGFSGDLNEAGQRGSDGLIQAIRTTHIVRRQEGIEYPEVDIRNEWQTVLSGLRHDGLLTGTISIESISHMSLEYECRVNPVWPMPESLSTLQELRERQLKLGLVSNAQFYTHFMFPALLGATHDELGFERNLCAWSYQIREVKPAKTMFQGILEYLDTSYGIMPQDTLYVGNDMLNDVWTASQCGLKTALFAGDQRSLRLREDDPRCAELEPDVVITRLSQLTDVL